MQLRDHSYELAKCCTPAPSDSTSQRYGQVNESDVQTPVDMCQGIEPLASFSGRNKCEGRQSLGRQFDPIWRDYSPGVVNRSMEIDIRN